MLVFVIRGGLHKLPRYHIVVSILSLLLCLTVQCHCGSLIINSASNISSLQECFFIISPFLLFLCCFWFLFLHCISLPFGCFCFLCFSVAFLLLSADAQAALTCSAFAFFSASIFCTFLSSRLSFHHKKDDILLVLLINLPLFYLLLLAWHWRSTTTLITYMDAAFFWFTAHISIFRGLHAILNKEEEKKLCPI
jgi:hypothetical protein